MSDLDQLRELVRPHALSFEVEYSEAEDLWYGTIQGITQEEYKEFKKYSDVDDLLERMISHVRSLG